MPVPVMVGREEAAITAFSCQAGNGGLDGRLMAGLRGPGRRGRLTGQLRGTTAAMGSELLCGVVACGRVQARHGAKIERSTNNLSAARRIVQGLSREATPSDYFELLAALALPPSPSPTGLNPPV
ncbi:MAG TPA: hypothetical protein VMU26_12940 [Candidatus Polarisedimenticolia bacterium]|nr:hypothetical protein [Candidatus Polarisedimenticolia bacterium]